MKTSSGVVEIERRIAARPETVFGFLVDPERFRKWQGANAELDPRPGGAFRVTGKERPNYTSVGEYVVVDPPTRLVFTWGWEPNAGLDDAQAEVPPGSTTVEIVLARDGDGTVLRLRHDGLPTETACVFHGMGWEWTLDNIEAGLASEGAV